MPVFDRTPKSLPTQAYEVIKDVQNLHIAGRKVHKGDEIALSAPQAEHWLTEGVIALKGAAPAEEGAAPSSEGGAA